MSSDDEALSGALRVYRGSGCFFPLPVRGDVQMCRLSQLRVPAVGMARKDRRSRTRSRVTSALMEGGARPVLDTPEKQQHAEHPESAPPAPADGEDGLVERTSRRRRHRSVGVSHSKFVCAGVCLSLLSSPTAELRDREPKLCFAWLLSFRHSPPAQTLSQNRSLFCLLFASHRCARVPTSRVSSSYTPPALLLRFQSWMY